ncbi:unnamed protein product [Amoebophrya sp. A120]|nr:unnamed protein product [Amoebophrya sp. A120]|eukprot:GSA120T00017349001.1
MRAGLLFPLFVGLCSLQHVAVSAAPEILSKSMMTCTASPGEFSQRDCSKVFDFAGTVGTLSYSDPSSTAIKTNGATDAASGDQDFFEVTFNRGALYLDYFKIWLPTTGLESDDDRLQKRQLQFLMENDTYVPLDTLTASNPVSTVTAGILPDMIAGNVGVEKTGTDGVKAEDKDGTTVTVEQWVKGFKIGGESRTKIIAIGGLQLFVDYAKTNPSVVALLSQAQKMTTPELSCNTTSGDTANCGVVFNKDDSTNTQTGNGTDSTVYTTSGGGNDYFDVTFDDGAIWLESFKIWRSAGTATDSSLQNRTLQLIIPGDPSDTYEDCDACTAENPIQTTALAGRLPLNIVNAQDDLDGAVDAEGTVINVGKYVKGIRIGGDDPTMKVEIGGLQLFRRYDKGRPSDAAKRIEQANLVASFVRAGLKALMNCNTNCPDGMTQINATSEEAFCSKMQAMHCKYVVRVWESAEV